MGSLHVGIALILSLVMGLHFKLCGQSRTKHGHEAELADWQHHLFETKVTWCDIVEYFNQVM